LPTLTNTQIHAIAMSGGTNKEIESALGAPMSKAQRAIANKARLEVKLKKERGRREKALQTGETLPDEAVLYNKRKERERLKQAAMSRAGRDIGDIPAVVDPERRKACLASFKLFCETYYPDVFNLAWSPDHLRVIERVETVVKHGGLFALAMPRSSGKSSTCEAAVVWAALSGIHEFIVLISSEVGLATEQLDSIKTDFETNDLLAEDFPEVCYPIEKLERINNRASGQTCNGKHTRIKWTSNMIILPTIEGAATSGVIIKTAGITGRIRGMKYKRPHDHRTVRPSLVLLDDPQTDESAASIIQCDTRFKIINGAVYGLGGPGVKISGLMACTIIEKGDLSDTVLDRKKNPRWQGEIMKMVYAFPTSTALWDKYAEIRRNEFIQGGDGEKATNFYRDNRAEMDAGARVAWEQNFYPGELSALQHAMNLKYDDEYSFFAEYQNEPIPRVKMESNNLTEAHIIAKLNGLERLVIPEACTKITAFVDVQQDLLYYMVCAWENDFTGYIVQYETLPKQPVEHFTKATVRRKLEHEYKGGLEATLHAGLTALLKTLITHEWKTTSGEMMRIARIMVDANWNKSTDIVYQLCRKVEFAGVVIPSHGKGVGASKRPFSEYTDHKGDRSGFHWRMPATRGKRQVRHILIDTNFYKSFVVERLMTAPNDRGSLSIFGKNPSEHRLLADHLMAEFRTEAESCGRKVDEWALKTGTFDNDFFDCLVGCAVAGSEQGIVLPGTDVRAISKRRQKLKLSEMQKKRHDQRHRR
jgi:hypothetical protein